MKDCELIEGCAFFNDTLGTTPDLIIQGYKHRYCKTDSSNCARYLVATSMGREHVPVDLGPHELEKGQKIMAHRGA